APGTRGGARPMSRTLPHRLPEGGRIDRDQPISFSFDGRRLEGCGGDTLASALLANGVTLVGRSFKYHRPRGLMSAGIEEPIDGPAAGWLTDRLADLAQLPNVRALTRTTAIGLYDGNMVALVERRGHLRPDPAKGEAREIAVSLRAKAVLFATGALERPLV